MIIKIFLIISVIIAGFMYLVILGANKNKSTQEKEVEDQEQIKALREWRQKHDR